MALKIKKGSVINHYGSGGNAFDENSELSQDVLAHLQASYPDDIEGTFKEEKAAPVVVEDVKFVPVPASVSGDLIAVTSTQNAAAVTGAQDEPTVSVEAIEEVADKKVITKKK